MPTGKTKDVVVVGYGASELENILEEELNELDMYITPDPAPEKGFFYRSDHISFAKKVFQCFMQTEEWIYMMEV